MKDMKSVWLKPGKERAVVNRHPWIFSGAIAKKSKDISPGDEITINDHQGSFLAKGHWCSPEGLSCRILSFEPDVSFDEGFYKARFAEAFAARKRFLLPNINTNGYRLIFGEADGLSGLVCDIFADTASIELSNPGLSQAMPLLADFLHKELGVRHVYCHESSLEQGMWLKGQSQKVRFLEQGLLFQADIDGGQKTGHFLDQRDNRQLVREWAHERQVLDAFCYSGGFSVYALAGQANRVTSVDIAEKAIDLCSSNVAVNGFSARHEAIKADCFSYLRHVPKNAFDFIILDPPAFAKSAQAQERAARGYKDINWLMLKAIAPGGVLLTFSCSQHIDEDLFQKIIFAAAKDAKREVSIVKKLGQGVDHPVSLYCPQSQYLKGLALYVR